ncbi:aminotransferase class V-fold PLP-dependent enzyme [Dyadobacter tibetensis]|uniref:aminotransferase class V-fold PLP-dependent enzyme n=1 Tax=Dyadobacter tibetensis TaxID=1211851 RepID=UPI000471C06B|nr:aminotransferase class V-fold PLP-dependent enzyme [Dyadobacter tibetensis]
MISFYPGPSKIYPQVATYLQEAFDSGILSQNHRSEGFMELMDSTLRLVKNKLAVPADYEVFLVSSATECWEIIAQSFTQTGALHVYNGAFGKKWMEYDAAINSQVSGCAFSPEQLPVLDEVLQDSADHIICLTHNETSNGTYIPDTLLMEVRSRHSHLIAIDATSSMAGLNLPWTQADIWFASVQKCFGLPPGLAVLIVSPRAIAQAASIGERNHYNSFLFIRDNFLKFQTPYTPNTLGIYLLNRCAESIEPILMIDAQIRNRAETLYTFFEDLGLSPVVARQELRSPTVLAWHLEDQALKKLKELAKKNGIVLGNGYGPWKNNTFRIANFPAITDPEVEVLKTFLERAF